MPKITQTHSDMGRGCQASGAPSSGMMLIVAAYAWRRSRRSRRRMMHLGLVAIVMLGCSTMLACQSQPSDCGGKAAVFDANAPLILSLGMVRQIASDPWHVVLALDFVDPDGDLGAGTAYYYANHSTTPTQTFAMSDILASSGGVDPNATSGRVQMLVRLLTTTPQDAVLHLSTRLVDAQGHASNCYGLDLHLGLQPSDANTLLQVP
jgi:uncharacterized protein (TIGR03382 family)